VVNKRSIKFIAKVTNQRDAEKNNPLKTKMK